MIDLNRMGIMVGNRWKIYQTRATTKISSVKRIKCHPDHQWITEILDFPPIRAVDNLAHANYQMLVWKFSIMIVTRNKGIVLKKSCNIKRLNRRSRFPSTRTWMEGLSIANITCMINNKIHKGIRVPITINFNSAKMIRKWT